MFAGFFLIGFIAGYIVSITGGLALAKRTESNAIATATACANSNRAQVPKCQSAEQDYLASVPSNWLDD